MAAAALLVAPVASAVAESGRVLRSRPEGIMVLDRVRREHGLSGTVLSTGVYQHVYEQYVPHLDVRYGEPRDLSPVDTVVVGAVQCRNQWDRRGGRAIVAVNRAEGRLRLVHEDRLVTVYAVDRPLRVPRPAEVAAQPEVDRTRGC